MLLNKNLEQASSGRKERGPTITSRPWLDEIQISRSEGAPKAWEREGSGGLPYHLAGGIFN